MIKSKMQQKQIMEENGIPYDEIDPEMREFIYLLNFVWGIKTKFCCIGEEDDSRTYIMFDDSVTDEEILKLHDYLKELNIYKNIFNKYFRFYKWMRTGYKKKTKMNWIWEANEGKNIKIKKEFVNKICNKIKEDDYKGAFR